MRSIKILFYLLFVVFCSLAVGAIASYDDRNALVNIVPILFAIATGVVMSVLLLAMIISARKHKTIVAKSIWTVTILTTLVGFSVVPLTEFIYKISDKIGSSNIIGFTYTGGYCPGECRSDEITLSDDKKLTRLKPLYDKKSGEFRGYESKVVKKLSNSEYDEVIKDVAAIDPSEWKKLSSFSCPFADGSDLVFIYYRSARKESYTTCTYNIPYQQGIVVDKLVKILQSQ
jgi:hypothetical protein